MLRREPTPVEQAARDVAQIVPDSAPAAAEDASAITPYQYAAQQMRGQVTTQIDLSDQPHLHDIPPVISSCRYLTSLNLSGTGVAELEALASLPRLERLALWGTRVRDLSALRTVKSLRWLSLGCTDVVNIDALADLPDLEVLDLSHTAVEDLAPLASCIRMRELILRGTQIRCIKPVARMRDLMLLDIAGTQVSETHPVKVLKNLSWFNTGTI
ncbi:MAG: hypothetical protein RIT14_347 [Pseudomonadota bacterium]|jgi:Leucine-rich repeat (LRR) protein